jgi:hypothetical protein
MLGDFLPPLAMHSLLPLQSWSFEIVTTTLARGVWQHSQVHRRKEQLDNVSASFRETLGIRMPGKTTKKSPAPPRQWNAQRPADRSSSLGKVDRHSRNAFRTPWTRAGRGESDRMDRLPSSAPSWRRSGPSRRRGCSTAPSAAGRSRASATRGSRRARRPACPGTSCTILRRTAVRTSSAPASHDEWL